MSDLSGIPQCGLACLAASLSASKCAATNTTCLCDDQGFASVVSSCVMSNCTIRESLVVKNATSSNCGYIEPNQNTSLNVICIVLLTLQTIFFALRMLCRAMRIASWGWDDTTIVVAFVLNTSFIGAAVLESHNGLGRNIWTIHPDQINSFLKVFFAFEIIYVVVLATIKISICFLFLRIFPGHRFRVASWATQIFNVALCATYLVADVLQCRPISFFWMGWDGEHEGTCWNLEAGFLAHAGINIILDVWMLALPASQIWHLNLSMRKKAGILAMIGFGILLTVISIIRLLTLKHFANSRNPTMDFYSVSIWTGIELTAGFMVACMPACRLLVVHCVTHIWCSDRTRLDSAPQSPRSGNSESNGDRSSVQTLKGKRLQNSPSQQSLSSKQSDRDRPYSMRFTITPVGKFDPFGLEELQLAEGASRFMDFPEESGDARCSRCGDHSGWSERSWTPSESLERPGRCLVPKNMAVSTKELGSSVP